MPRSPHRFRVVALAGITLAAAPLFPAKASGPSPPPANSCAVDVYSKRLSGPGYATGARHLWIVHSLGADRSGNGQEAIRGGPSNPGAGGSSGSGTGSSGSEGNGDNVIEVRRGPWDPSFIDWGGDGEVYRRVLDSPEACGKRNCFRAEQTRVNDRRVRYKATGPNSNTVVSTMLHRCGVPRERPDGFHPGWDDPDL